MSEIKYRLQWGVCCWFHQKGQTRSSAVDADALPTVKSLIKQGWLDLEKELVKVQSQCIQYRMVRLLNAFLASGKWSYIAE